MNLTITVCVLLFHVYGGHAHGSHIKTQLAPPPHAPFLHPQGRWLTEIGLLLSSQASLQISLALIMRLSLGTVFDFGMASHSWRGDKIDPQMSVRKVLINRNIDKKYCVYLDVKRTSSINVQNNATSRRNMTLACYIFNRLYIVKPHPSSPIQWLLVNIYSGSAPKIFTTVVTIVL